MADEPRTTGDIIWKKLDPKTFYLYNEPEPKPEEGTEGNPTQAEAEQPTEAQKALMDKFGGMRFNAAERAMFEYDMANNGPQVATDRAKRHFHTRQLAQLNHDLVKDPNMDTMDIQGRIQELMDSGALRIDQNGDLYSSIPLGAHANTRILEATRHWLAPAPKAPEEEMSDQPTLGSQPLAQSVEQQMNEMKSMGMTQPPDEGEQ